MKKNRVKNGMKICNFLSKLFRNKDFISQESPILADEKIQYEITKISSYKLGYSSSVT